METMILFLAVEAGLISRTFELPIDVFFNRYLLPPRVTCVHGAEYSYSAHVHHVHPKLPPEENTTPEDRYEAAGELPVTR